jgi:hypothetical protein
MTLPVVPGSSLSFSQINTELGLSSTATISLNDAAVRTLAGVGASPATIAITNLSGKSNEYAFTISSNQTNANLRTLAVNAGWDQSTKVAATIGSGVQISSTRTGTPALTVNGSFPGGVSLINTGVIVGKGGGGGNGRDQGQPGSGGAGSSGGTGLAVSVALTVTNASGTISGGGGGGGGGGGIVICCVFAAGGGGGGGGNGFGAGGSGGNNEGVPGSTGGQLSGGGGGGGGPSGGSGGSNAASGASGSGGRMFDGGPPVPGGSGGSGGAAITGNSNITYVSTGTRYGSIS